MKLACNPLIDMNNLCLPEGLPSIMRFAMSDVGLVDNKATTIRDLWAHRSQQTQGGAFTTSVAPHGSVMLTLSQEV